MTSKRAMGLTHAASGALWIGGAGLGMQLGWPLVVIAAGYVLIASVLLARVDRPGPSLGWLWLAAVGLWVALLVVPDLGSPLVGILVGTLVGSLTFGAWAGTAALLRLFFAQQTTPRALVAD